MATEWIRFACGRGRRGEFGSDAGHGSAPARLALIALVLALAVPQAASAATFYVNNGSAFCSNSGPGTLSNPYCTISAALAAQHAPGTTILVLPGVYHEQVTFNASGSSGSPIVIQAQPQPGNPVVVDGADDFSNTGLWSAFSGGVFLASSVTWSPRQVFANGARLADSLGATPASLPAGCFLWVSGQGLYVNVGGDNPGLHQAAVGHRATCFYVGGQSWVTIDGFTVLHSEQQAIRMTSGGSHVSITHNLVDLSGSWGIQADACTAMLFGSNTVSNSAYHGMGLTGGTSGSTVQDNESFNNLYPTTRLANGLYMYGATGNLIQRNRFHDNQDTGEQFSPGSNNNISLQNRSWHNGDHGYDHLNATGNFHVGDVAWGNYKDGFSIEGLSSGHTLYDCIATDNGLTTNEFDLWVDSNSSVGFTSNDNLFWNSTSQAPVKYISTIYSSVAAYSAASGQDTRTIQADPRFANAAGGDFHLLAGSPAIDSGNSGVANWPSLDAAGNARVDDPGTPNTGLGPIAYADRGALEYQTSGTSAVTAKLTVTPTSGQAPLAVTADASASTDVGSTIVSYKFDFGDGTVVGPQSGATANHTYAAGNWTCTVTVTDALGATGTASVPVSVSAAPPPVARLTVTPSSGQAPLAVKADASSSTDAGSTIASYKFDFGDGTVVGPQSGATANHTYAAGNWTCIVTVTDALGASDTASAPVSVTAVPPPVARLTVTPNTGYASLGITADASASTDPTTTISSYKFDFGDGTVVGPQSGATANHTYATGKWTVTVTVTDALGSSATATAGVQAAPNPTGTNLAGNPSFESGLAGWTGVGSASLAQVSGGFDGSFALQLTSPSGSTGTFGVTDQPNWIASTPAAGTKYRFIAWVQSASSHGQAQLRVRESLGRKKRPVAGSQAVTLGPGWQYLALDYSANWAGSTIDLQIVDQPATTNERFLTDAITIVANPSGAATPAGALLASATPEDDAADPADAIVLAGNPPRLLPNPMRAQASFAFTVSRAGSASVQIFDLGGRLVRTLAAGTPAQAGENVLTFDGLADDGAPLGRGMYFYRVLTPDGAASGRFVILR